MWTRGLGGEKRRKEKERKRERVALYAYENIQVSIKARDLWTLGCRARDTHMIFPLKIYVFIHARTAHANRERLVGQIRRAGREFCLLFHHS